MNTKFFLSSLFIAAVFFISCKKELEPQESFVTSATTEVKDKATTGVSPAQIQPNTTATVVSNTTAISNTTGGLNPAHGQPGHRCDIAVGQPLNTPSATNVTPQNTTQTLQQTIPPTAVANTNTVAKGMNPPHGQPGHRCDIAVGQPLNSPPGKTATPQAVSTPTTITQTIVNPDGTTTTGEPKSTATPTILNSPTTVASGINPAHGQPGHRCDIAVGQPLPKS